MEESRFIVDATELFTGLIGKGVTKELLFSQNLELFAPEFLFEELNKHKSRIALLSKLPLNDIDKLIARLQSRIKIVDKSKFESFLHEATSLIPDPDDTEYLALSLSMKNCPIWSEDPHFKKQSLVGVFSTKELVEYLKSKGLF